MSSRPVFRIRIPAIVLSAAACSLFFASPSRAQDEKLFKGQIVQCVCPGADSRPAAPGKPAGASCPSPCAKPGTTYFFVDGKSGAAYHFDKEDMPRVFAGYAVYVMGAVDKGSDTIRLNNIVPDVNSKIKRAKTAAIVCDACPRAMAKAKPAVFEELSGWGRFTLVPDSKNADLIFLLSANPYLGDYVTRDGPDKRPVHVEITYMNVVDPKTGESLWGDHQRVGSWFVAPSAKDLVDELREIMEADVSASERKEFLARHHIYRTATDLGK